MSRSCARGLLVLSLLFGTSVGASPTDAQRRAMQAGIARGVLDARAVQALEQAEWVRIVAVFAREPAALPTRYSDASLAQLVSIGFHPARRYASLPVLVGEISAEALAALAADPHVVRVGPEAQLVPQLAEAVPLVNLDDAHAAGMTGAGAQVAILDTGVDLAHADLAGAVVAERCFCDNAPGPAGCCPNGLDSQSGTGASQDDHGHGTRVAGIVTSAGVHAPLGGAPDAQLVEVKVISSAGTATVADLLAGLDWVLVFHSDVAVVNLSLGGGLYSGDCDSADAVTMAFASAVNQLHDAGVLTVAGSGNNQSSTSMIAPACVAKAVSVGAVWDANVGSQTYFGCTDATTAADKIACWSNASATTDVLAPGGAMTSSLLGGTTVTLAGTSYATPIVSSCAAVLRAAHPAASVDAMANALKTSGVNLFDARNGRTYPRLDCMAADAYLRSPPVPALSGRALPAAALVIVLVGLAVLRPRSFRLGR